MKLEYTKPSLELLGRVRDITASSGNPIATDVPLGTPVTPIPPNFGVLGSH